MLGVAAKDAAIAKAEKIRIGSLHDCYWLTQNGDTTSSPPTKSVIAAAAEEQEKRNDNQNGGHNFLHNLRREFPFPVWRPISYASKLGIYLLGRASKSGYTRRRVDAA
jgi:hypothetical protein